MYAWNTLPWKTIQVNVFKLQKRIYQASLRNDQVSVRKLQRLLIGSWSAKALAVRTVSQDNRGKRTAGVDGVKNITPPQRMNLIEALNLTDKTQPVRRIWIPKPGKPEKRPLGIPTLKEQARQALAKLALEPEWEAKFEPNSYGFRPGRSAHDAIEAIFTAICKLDKYVLDADIKACFDRINHQALVEKIKTFGALKHLIRNWLKAGIMEGEQLFPSEEGTPQGGVISPLLANIALHGLETAIQKGFPISKGTAKQIAWQPTVIRYADVFIILHRDPEALRQATQIAQNWLQAIGLELNTNKTTIRHTLREHQEGKPGFDFLGFSVRQFPATTKQGFKTIIKPSKNSTTKHQHALKGFLREHKHTSQEELIQRLNRKISGWAGPIISARWCRRERLA